MKSIKYIVMAGLVLMGAACQKKEFRKVYPNETPELTASIAEKSVTLGEDSLTLNVAIKAQQTPLSTLTVKVLVDNTVAANEVIRTKDLSYEASLKYAIPFGANMPKGAAIKAYLTAENVEGDQAKVIVEGCQTDRPAIETLKIMPPTINYTKIGKGLELTKSGDYDFTAEAMAFPKSFQCLLAVEGTKFGRVNYEKPVFGMVDGQIALLSKEIVAEIKNNPDAAENYAITIENDQLNTIETIKFSTLTFEYEITGTVLEPVKAIDIAADLEEEPAYISSSSVRKQFRGAKIFFDKDSEVEITGAVDLSKAYNLTYMEYLGGNKVKFLGEKAMYYLSYNIEEDYLVVEPMYDLKAPEVMWIFGVGIAQPSWSETKTLSSNWGFDHPQQAFAGRTVEPKVYEFVIYMENKDAEDANHPGFGTVNFKFFHQHAWGGEEAGADYTQVCCEGMKIIGSTEEGNVGNWWATSDPFEGVYRVTLDMNKMETRYEKIR